MQNIMRICHKKSPTTLGSAFLETIYISLEQLEQLVK